MNLDPSPILSDNNLLNRSGWKTRFAPSPSGHLHLGHLVNILYTWGMARAFDGEIILRIEDHDQQRSKPLFIDSIRDDLSWLNLRDYRSTPKQSERIDKYQLEIKALNQVGQLYACHCSRNQIKSYQNSEHSELRYRGDCSNKRKRIPSEELFPVKPIKEAPFAIRLRTLNQYNEFHPFQLNSRTSQLIIKQNPYQQCGDFTLFDKNSNFSYQYCVSSDDLEDEIDLVIRGSDLFESTGRQIFLQKLIHQYNPTESNQVKATYKPPHYFHHPLILDGSGQKLSKKDLSKSLKDWKAEGYQPKDLFEMVVEQLEKTNQLTLLPHSIEPRQFLKYL